MRILKWISWAFAALVVLVALALAVVVWVVDPNRFKPRIEAEVKKATGREFALVGDIDIGFYPWLALRTGPGQFGNPPGFPAEPMVSWRGARLGARLFPLLRGELAVDRVRLEGADVRLVRRADGSANWQGIGAQQPAAPQAKKSAEEARSVTVAGIEIVDSRVSFVDEVAPGRRVEVTDLRLTTDAIAPGEPLTDTEIAGTLRMDGFAEEGVPFRLEVPHAALTRENTHLAVRAFEVAFGGLEAGGGLEGSFADPMKMSGTLRSNSFDLRALLASIGMEAPATTDPEALTRLRVETSWSLDAGALSLDPLELGIDDTRFEGGFRRGAGDDPVGEFALRGDSLNLSRYIPPTDPESEPFVLPTAMLETLKFRGTLELEQVTMDDIVMKGVTLRLVLDENGLRSVEKGP